MRIARERRHWGEERRDEQEDLDGDEKSSDGT
jgi:hypothetical protein